MYGSLQGASFGYHAGGWGKPPVDEQGKPLYGDVFGIQQQEAPVLEEDEQIESQPWGELESESEEESESEVWRLGQVMLLNSWIFSSSSTRTHWLLRGHMSSNNKTFPANVS